MVHQNVASPAKTKEVTKEVTDVRQAHTSKKSKDALVVAGKKLFARGGLEGVSVKELGEATGLNPALVCYYFGGKEGLYRECLSAISAAGLATIQRTLRTPTSQEEFVARFEMFAEEFVARFLEERDACMILKRDSNTAVAQQVYQEHIVTLVERFHTFIQEAQQAGFVKPEVDTQLVAHLVLHTLFGMITADLFRSPAQGASAERQPYFVTTEEEVPGSVRQVVVCLLQGLVTHR